MVGVVQHADESGARHAHQLRMDRLRLAAIHTQHQLAEDPPVLVVDAVDAAPGELAVTGGNGHRRRVDAGDRFVQGPPLAT